MKITTNILTAVSVEFMKYQNFKVENGVTVGSNDFIPNAIRRQDFDNNKNDLVLETVHSADISTWLNSSSNYLVQKAKSIQHLKHQDLFNTDVYLLDPANPPAQSKLNLGAIAETHWLTVSDNPVKNNFYITSSAYDAKIEYQIYDIKGIMIDHGSINNGIQNINSSLWQSGTYIIEALHPSLGADRIKITK